MLELFTLLNHLIKLREKLNLMEDKIKIGVSSCLLGEEVRWNGDHKKDRYVQGVLDNYFTMYQLARRWMWGWEPPEKP